MEIKHILCMSNPNTDLKPEKKPHKINFKNINITYSKNMTACSTDK